MNMPFASKWVLAAKSPRFWWILTASAAVGIVIQTFRLPGGEDLYRYYIPFVNGCLDCGFVPYYAQWFLAPLRLLPPYPYTWPVWTVMSLAVFAALAYLTKINPFLFFISMPLLGQVLLGQIDVYVCAGLALLLLSRNPWLGGLGIAVALIKPQVAALPIVLYLLPDLRHLSWKMLVIPLSVFLASLIVYGIGWPREWITNALSGLPTHVWRLAAGDTWRIGILLTPTVFLFQDSRKRLEASLLISSLAIPFFGVYSYITFLLFRTKWWYIPLSFAWALAMPWLGESAMRFAWILPLTILSEMLYERWRGRRFQELARPAADDHHF